MRILCRCVLIIITESMIRIGNANCCLIANSKSSNPTALTGERLSPTANHSDKFHTQ